MYSLLFESNQGDRLTNNGFQGEGLQIRLEYVKKIYVVILVGYNFILFFNLASILVGFFFYPASISVKFWYNL